MQIDKISYLRCSYVVFWGMITCGYPCSLGIQALEHYNESHNWKHSITSMVDGYLCLNTSKTQILQWVFVFQNYNIRARTGYKIKPSKSPLPLFWRQCESPKIGRNGQCQIVTLCAEVWIAATSSFLRLSAASACRRSLAIRAASSASVCVWQRWRNRANTKV